MEKIDKDAEAVIIPSLSSDEDDRMHFATQQAIDDVEVQLNELRTCYGDLTDLCQRKRDTFVLCVRFHMMARQVRQ